MTQKTAMAARPMNDPAPLAYSPSAEANKLDSAVMRGIAWTGAAKWVAQIVSWASTLMVARLLVPEDYGLVGMATVYMGLVALINEFGLGTAIVTLHKLDKDQVAQINSLSILLGLAGFSVSIFAAAPLALFYGAPQLRWVVIVMSAAFIITAFKTVPYSLLQKELRFKALALIDGAQAVFQALITIALALLGLRFWALVFGGLAGALLSTILVASLRPRGFSKPSIKSLREAVTFSRQILLGRLSWFVSSNADFVVAGRVLGGAALGAYNFAWTLASVPIDKIGALLTQVTPAFFAALQTDQAALRRYLLKLTQALALITVPVSIGLCLVADDFVMLVLGEKWRAVVTPLQLLALSTSFRSLTTLFGVILNATRQSRFTMYNCLVAAVLFPIAFFLFGSRWGTTGIASVWLVVFPISAIPYYRRTFTTIGLPVSQYLRSIWPAVSASLTMAVVVLLIKFSIATDWKLPLRFAIETLGGATVYGLFMFIFHPRLLSFREVLRTLRG